MGKISNLIFIGAAAYAVKYYLENPKKAEEHKNILKEKMDNSIGYTKCMWNYTQKNGLTASAEYLKNDLNRVVKRNIEKLNSTVDNTVKYGKQIASDTMAIKDNAIAIKDNGAELTSNIAEATKILKEEMRPALNNYVQEVKEIVSSITTKSEDLKETIKKDEVKEKIQNYKEKVDSFITATKDKLDDVLKTTSEKTEK